MHARCLKQATRHFLTAYWSLEGGTEVRIADPPGRPVGVVASWACLVHDAAQSYGREGRIALYGRYGCVLTVSQKLDAVPEYDLEGWLDDRKDGYVQTRDALVGLLHRYRFTVQHWANLLANSREASDDGLVNGMVEAPRVVSMTAPTRRGPDWWGAGVMNLVRPTGEQAEEARVFGYSSDIVFGEALTVQPEPVSSR